MHCGLCLPACPTYTQNGLEADSPRGRIQLMLGLHEGRIEPTETVRHHLDLCLDCRACETACPSNVVYHELIEETRAKLPAAKQSVGDRLVRWMFLHVLTRPMRLKLALAPARILQKIGLYRLIRRSGLLRLLPAGLQKMEGMLPDDGTVWAEALRTNGALSVRSSSTGDTPLAGTSVAFFPGCVGSVMFDRVNQQAVDLLRVAGCRVSAPAAACCGAIHHHNGLHEPSMAMARQVIDAFLPAGAADPPAYIVTTIAGCGAMLRDYATLLRDDPAYAARAADFAGRVRDITEVLAATGPLPLTHRVELTATYHDACHLVHAQKVATQPRALLAAVPGLTLVPLAESDMCCGAAGTYNLTQPAMAADLAERKLRHVAATGATVCIAGNVGCSMHLQSAARGNGSSLKLVHPVEILHQSVFGT